MDLPAIFRIVTEILNTVLTILGVTQSLGDRPTAQETEPLAIQTIATNGTNTVIHPTWGNHALLNAIGLVRIDASEGHDPTIDDVLTQIALLTPVTLPEVPPPGYGPGDEVSPWLSNLETYDWCAVD